MYIQRVKKRWLILLHLPLPPAGLGQCAAPEYGAGPGLADGALQTTHGPAAGLAIGLSEHLVQFLPTETSTARHSHTIR